MQKKAVLVVTITNTSSDTTVKNLYSIENQLLVPSETFWSGFVKIAFTAAFRRKKM